MEHNPKHQVSVRTKNQIIEELFKSTEFNECISRMEPAHLRDDLKGEVMLILLEKPTKEIQELEKRKGLRFYTVRIILNLIQSKTSPFFKMYRAFNSNIIPDKQADNGLDERLKRELVEDRAREIITGLYWYDREIVELYIRLGSYRAIEKETGIPWESCYSTVRKVIKQIRDELKPV